MPDLERPLTAKQARFVEEYLSNGGNASAAYRTAFNAKGTAQSVAGQAVTLKKHPKVARALAEAEHLALAAVNKALTRYAIDQDALAEKMARLAFTDLRQVVTLYSTHDPKLGPDGKPVIGGDGKPVTVRHQHLEVLDFDKIDIDAHQALTEIKRAAGGEITVKLADKRQAMMDLARIKGWIADKPVEMQQLVALKIER